MPGLMQNLRPLRFLLALGIAASVIGAVSAKTEAPAATKPAAKKLVLEKGTAADDILKAYGTPFKVLPLETTGQDLKAETWIYRRKSGETVTQEHLSDNVETYTFTTNVTNGVGTAQPVKISTPVLKTKRVTTYQVTSLLIVNGRLEIARLRQETEESYL
ncbi:MAG: hypothetical protein QG602_2139 [Verrucomicrobiota bacterium]|nr:hypothetical protein [Verrucomicrobiota bacterium]